MASSKLNHSHSRCTVLTYRKMNDISNVSRLGCNMCANPIEEHEQAIIAIIFTGIVKTTTNYKRIEAAIPVCQATSGYSNIRVSDIAVLHENCLQELVKRLEKTRHRSNWDSSYLIGSLEVEE